MNEIFDNEFMFTNHTIPFPKQALVFMCLQYKSLKKKVWENERLLVGNNFSFSLSVFYPFGQLSAIFIKFCLGKS